MKQKSNLEETYNNLIKSGEIENDENQKIVINHLDKFGKSLNTPSKFSKLGFFNKVKNLIGIKNNYSQFLGVYIYGGVGRGKSMLMDLFFENTTIKHKKRVHFHEFIRDAHKKLHEYRKLNIQNPIQKLAKEISKNIKLICFDELQILDITDAMLVKRLFEALILLDVRFVITSNRHPNGLYENGLNRPLFIPFIDMVKQYFQILHLDAPYDYRQKNNILEKHYLYPIDDNNRKIFKQIWSQINKGKEIKEQTIEVMGRKIKAHKSSDDIAIFPFPDLFKVNYGVNDYEEVTNKFKIIFIDNIPLLTPEMRNEATRFRNFIDIAYEKKTKLYFLCDTSPEDLYTEGDFYFEFQRTISRIKEIISIEYNRKN